MEELNIEETLLLHGNICYGIMYMSLALSIGSDHTQTDQHIQSSCTRKPFHVS
jgi:hypothetical protein